MAACFQSSSGEELQGVVLKLRKASRRLAFVTLELTQLAIGDEYETSEGKREVQVMFESDQGTDWRSACFPEGDGKRVCCGSMIAALCVPDNPLGTDNVQSNDSTGNGTARVTMACYRALRASVSFSPHDAMTESGAVRQHPAVERIAASHREPSHRRARKEDATFAMERASKTTVPPLCRQWWRGKCEKSSEGDRAAVDSPGGSRTCWRRHYFVDEEEQERFEKLRDKAARMQAEEEGVVADDPHPQVLFSSSLSPCDVECTVIPIAVVSHLDRCRHSADGSTTIPKKLITMTRR
eukprot:1897233-Rhodomonas_salina.1